MPKSVRGVLYPPTTTCHTYPMKVANPYPRFARSCAPKQSTYGTFCIATASKTPAKNFNCLHMHTPAPSKNFNCIHMYTPARSKNLTVHILCTHPQKTRKNPLRSPPSSCILTHHHFGVTPCLLHARRSRVLVKGAKALKREGKPRASVMCPNKQGGNDI